MAPAPEIPVDASIDDASYLLYRVVLQSVPDWLVRGERVRAALVAEGPDRSDGTRKACIEVIDPKHHRGTLLDAILVPREAPRSAAAR